MVASPAAPKALKDKTTINTQKRNIAVLSYPDSAAFRHQGADGWPADAGQDGVLRGGCQPPRCTRRHLPGEASI
jgi:hypothetical protein